MSHSRSKTVVAPHALAAPLERRLRRGRWLALCTAAPLCACQQAGILDPHGPIASAERLLLINSTAIMLVVVVPVILATLVSPGGSGPRTRARVRDPE